MAFNNPQSFTNMGSASSADKQRTDGTYDPFFGTGCNQWGSSIWSNRKPSSLAPNGTIRGNSVSRDSINKQPPACPTEDTEPKTGSGSLVDSSVSEDFPHLSSWCRTFEFGRSTSNAQIFGNSRSQQKQSTPSNAGTFQTSSDPSPTSTTFTSHPPTVNLNMTTFAQPRQSYVSAFSTARNSELPPFNVYTKFDRPIEPSQKKTDSAIGLWAEFGTTPSPSDERRPQFPLQTERTFAAPISRDGSLPSSKHADDAPIFTRPDYPQPSQPITPDSSREPSVSSRNGVFYNYLNTKTDHVAFRMGQMSLDGGSRVTDTFYKPSVAMNGHAWYDTSSLSHPAFYISSSGHSRPDHIKDIVRANTNHLDMNESVLPKRSDHATPSHAERYLQFGSAYEIYPEKPHTGNDASQSYGLQNASRAASEWQTKTNGIFPLGGRSPATPDPQTYYDARLHQLMGAPLHNSYPTMYNPYAIPNGIHLNGVPAYLSMLPISVPSAETSGARDSSFIEGVQSALMYEFKSNTKTKRYELRDIYDHIAEFSGDQHGSRFIQTKLETANSDEKDRVFREIQPNAIPLMTDVFGNYVIQKFFEHGDQTHKKILANQMRGEVLKLSLQMYGCRVVQKALDHVLVDQQALLINELEGHVLRCVKDQNGNHVIQKAIERCPSATIGFIISAFQGQAQHLSIHPYGCRVIQRCLEKSDLPSRSMIMSELSEGIHTMITDNFGNYVVQHIVAHDKGEPRQKVLGIVAQGLEGYSKHKFASNVVEKCLERADDDWRRQVVLTLAQTTQRKTEGDGVLVAMIKDSFSNYVIQKLLDTLCLEDYVFFLDYLHPAMQQAKRTGCGKQVLSIDKKMHRYDFYRNVGAPGVGPNFNRPTFQLQAATSPFRSQFNSAATTPPPLLTADSMSLQSSGLHSVYSDTVEGAISSRKGSEQSTDLNSR